MIDPATIERLAREAGLSDFGGCTEQNIARFAVLIEAQMKERAIDLVAFHGGSVEIEAAIRAL